MDLKCTCGFDLADLPAKRRIQATDGDTIVATCPMCGLSRPIRLQSLGILVRGTGPQTKYLRWKSGKTIHATTIPVGTASRMQLAFDTLEPIEPREVCYSAVPAFEGEDGQLVVPALPVRAENFDVIDLLAFARLVAEGNHAAVVGGEYQAQVPLRGLAEPQQFRLPLHRVRDPDGTERTAFKGINLRVWPNVPLSAWRYYLVGLATSSTSDLDPTRVKVAARTRDAADWTPVTSVQRKGTAIAGTSDGRPEWISLELEGAMAGGLFAIPSATAQPAGQLEVGLDFGTSNTCVGVQVEGAAPSLLRKIPEARWNLYVIRGGAEEAQHAGPDLWPSPTGFGADSDLFASELVFPVPRTEQMRYLATIADWRYGVDYGVPSASAEPLYPEAEYSLAEFKWNQLLARAAPTFASHIETLQRKYLTAVLLAAYLRSSMGSPSGHWPEQVFVTYSFPTSFGAEDMKALEDALAAVQVSLQEDSSIAWSIKPGLDESAAAAANAGELGADLHVYLDMGGGSTDIAITLAQQRSRAPVPIYLTSIRYAGTTLLSGYSGDGKQTSCLAGKATSDHLRRRVREAKTVTQVLGDPALFDQRQQAVTQNRTRHFYGYMIEHVARMLAAGFLDQRFKVEQPDGSMAVPSPLKIAVIFLGNGWRFDAALSPDFEATLAKTIYTRMQELVGAEAKTNEYARALLTTLRVKIEMKHATLRNVPHGKAAVAFGLLASPRERAASSGRPKSSARRSILGWTTVLDSRAEVPWFVRFDSSEQAPKAPGAEGEA